MQKGSRTPNDLFFKVGNRLKKEKASGDDVMTDWQSQKQLLGSLQNLSSGLEAQVYSVQLLVRELESLITFIRTMTSHGLGRECYNRQEEGQ